MDEIFDDADYLPKILFSGSPAPVPVTEIEIFEFVAGRPPDGYVFGRDAGVPVKSGQSVGHDLQNDVPVFEFVESIHIDNWSDRFRSEFLKYLDLNEK